ncbi:MAG: AMP-binding protein, partial [Actinobacteria bacterium]|nr:AMP-binding protein [Actinomycetota bacterium]
MNWCTVLAHHAERTPDKAIAVFEGEVTTYAEMAERSAARAAALGEQGVQRGDVVGLLSYNCTEFLEVIFAANHLGAIAMPINYRL